MSDLTLIGGSALILLGNSRLTLDIDFVGDDVHPNELHRQIMKIAKEIKINVEPVPIERFIPLPKGSEQRTIPIGQFGNLNVYVADPYSIALSKVDRGFEADFDDVVFLIQHNYINLKELERILNDALPHAGKFDFNPDILTMAKGLSSGYQPISAVSLGRRMSGVIAGANEELVHGYTYSGHPLAAAAGLATLELYRTLLAERRTHALGAGTLWGTTGPLSTALYAAGVPLTGIGFWRVLLGTAGLAVYGLVADRDLSERGVPVTFFGRPSRMPVGPAALSLKTGAPLIPATLHYDGADLVITFHDAVEPDGGAAAMTQRCADAFAAGIAAHLFRTLNHQLGLDHHWPTGKRR